MNALVRGRIENGEWVDQQSIWRTDIENYTGMPDMAAGGRIAFDDDGPRVHERRHQGRAPNSRAFRTFGLPYGKIHRVNDDG